MRRYGQTQSRDAELTLVTIHTKSQFGWKANESLNRGRRGGRPFFRNPGAVRAALNDHNGERARAPKHRERRRAPPPRALAWVGSTRCGAQHALSCVAPAVAEPTAARTGAEWLPDRARQAQSHRRGANANRAVAVRRSRQPPAVSRRKKERKKTDTPNVRKKENRQPKGGMPNVSPSQAEKKFF